MDEDYELVSKDLINKLRDENKRLREEFVRKPAEPEAQVVEVDVIVEKIVSVLREENKKEREVIMSSLEEIKELNKTTLDNLLVKTQGLDNQLEEMIDTISGLVDNLSNVASNFEKMSSVGFNGQDVESKTLGNLGDVLKKVDELKSNLKSDLSLFKDEIVSAKSQISEEKILKKLEEIDVFMKNLRVLLSYVKPSDVVLERK